MSFPLDQHTGHQPETNNNNNQSTNPSVFQPPHQMKNEYMHPPSSSSYSTQRYHQHHPHMNVSPNKEDITSSYQGKSSFMAVGQSKSNNLNKYYRQEEARFTPQGHQQVAEGRTDAHHAEDMRNSGDNVQYAFPSRDGPSPGRNYHYGIQQDEVQQTEEHVKQKSSKSNHPFRLPSTTISKSKRKAQNELSTPEGPRLISNQSSDDSINALLPSKRARLGSLFPSESASFMKSFTLSPMNSRTFSRDEAVEMPKFASRRGSADNSRIFHSWSSGNSRSENNLSSDVRNCYDDWHSGPPKRNSITNNGYNLPVDNPRMEQPNDQLNPISYDPRYHGNPPPPPPPPQHHNSWQGSTNSHDQQELDRMYNTNSRQLQPLHPEDRYNDQLFQGYGQQQSMEMNRPPYWNNHQSMPHGYQMQRRDDIEDRSMNHMVRGNHPPPPPLPHPNHHHHHHSQRLSAPTPPVTNGWGRYGGGNYHHSMYEPHGPVRSMAPSYEPWGQQNMTSGYDMPYHQMPMKDKDMSNYSDRMSHLKSVTIESGPEGTTGMRTADGLLLLSLPEDRISLSETLCIVRENVEVFIATEADVKAPAPGRKRPVIKGQVGLRCIHCRVAMHQSEKVKRAVCFPSSIKRIYRTVIDMKLDHFKACRFVPIELKLKLEELRATNARSTGTTMQYFVQAARRMGMKDGGHGISFERPPSIETQNPVVEVASNKISNNPTIEQTVPQPASSNASSIMRPLKQSSTPQQGLQSGMSFTLSLDLSMSGDSSGGSSKAKHAQDRVDKANSGKQADMKFYEGKLVLALPEDTAALSPLRCFLRENVCAFSATSEDIAVRTPTTFSVVLGQVGIGCVHCLSLPARERSNRAVCFPFSVNRIYQSVADIQRFHLGECKMVPPATRAKFLELQNASSKGSKGLATRTYWVTSAKKLGLVDSDNGIRFSRDPSIPFEKPKSLDILAQVASDVTTTAPPLVLPEDEPLIAGFLYVVMKQLQPCRFTEADRNKRRLKDVGCIGVECKHCAGQVDGRKFFWSSVNAVESNFVSVHTHMMECKMIGQELKDKLAHLKMLRKEQTTKLKSGSQKAFFARVWKRLHIEENKIPSGGGASVPKQHGVEQYDMLPSTESMVSDIPSASTPPICDFNHSSTGSPGSSISSRNSSTYNDHQESNTNVLSGAEILSPVGATFSPHVMTSELDNGMKEEIGMTSMNSSLRSSPMSPCDAITNITPIDVNVKEEENELKLNVSVIEEI